ncbi:ribosome biogenesis GTPase Der [Candidatus Gromoviella agglomerans]|uniref:ribosome biogenesis GTPase Der n=1 Tax=Candidatus Gromoviella agglomerans TaxID=2806609 RepID=UPI001E5834F8|nr:ribosome biogenesis GTPase Der [Candidatus Gromoviella agglomerans]UFX98506.1 GTPase Der [Candidatus Gromoviella agglomerans]
MFTIALIGRTNVGKSSLFNALVKRRSAIILDIPGTTNDYKEETINFFNKKVKLIDTGGYESNAQSIWNMTITAINKANLAIFVLNAQDGVMPDDITCAKIARKLPCIMVINKADKALSKYDLNEFYQLGFENVIFTSCTNNTGLLELQEKVLDILNDEEKNNDKPQDKIDDHCDGEQNFDKKIKLAIIGRPNSGKSTMLNSILQEERVLTSPIAGTTRDSIHTHFMHQGYEFELIDTAGIRRKRRDGGQIETASVKMALRSVKIADIVLIVIDASIAMDKQDLALCSMVGNEGKIPILVFNKWDLIKEKDLFLKNVEDIILKKLPEISGVECMFISAINSKQNYELMFDICIKLMNTSNLSIKTHRVNEVLREIQTNNINNKRKVNAKYATQISKSPHTFCVFFSQSVDQIPQQYLRYIRNMFAEKLNLHGVPVFIVPRSKNELKR